MTLQAITRVLHSFIRRDQIILSDLNSEVVPHSVNLHWWKLPSERQNIGDMLSPVVFDFLLQANKLTKSIPPTKTSHLYTIGSIIDGGYQDAVIWGSGLLRGKRQYWWRAVRKLDIRAVRGPLTRQVLISNGYVCPEVYGDPAILLPLIYQPADTAKRTSYRVIPHMSFGNNYSHVLSPFTVSWKNFIDTLVQTELVISSSLHGIILAESYGIPAILLNDHNMNLFKYYDYYASTGRSNIPIATTVEDALSMEPPSLPDLTALRSSLIKTFPVDLWN